MVGRAPRTQTRRTAADQGDAGPALVLDGVAKSFERGNQTVRAVTGFDLEVHPGQMVALTGPSGAGKSTVLHLAAGLLRPDRGRVVLSGQDLARLSDRQAAAVRRRHVGFVFQFFHLLPTLTVLENAALPLLLDNRPDALARATELLDAVGLSRLRSALPSQLAGGELQRVAVVRAMVAGPAVVLADEPTGSLDSASGRAVLDLLTDRARRSQSALLVATHDPAVAERADSVLTMHDGRLRR